MSEVTAGDALAVIAEVEPSALKMVGDIMEWNARATGDLFASLLEGERAAHEETRERLREANRRLAVIETRLLWVLGYDIEEDRL